LREINKYCLNWFNTQCIQTFKYKCHDKHYEFDNKDCRLVRIQESIKTDNIWVEILSQISLDILAVACHYSTRYGNSDSFIEICNDQDVSYHIMQMKNTTPEILADKFVKEYLHVVSSETKGDVRELQMSWKNMFYLWKQFLYTHQLPTTLFQSSIKTVITQERLSKYYNSTGDFFIGIDSSQLPIIQNFLRFWSETMIIDEMETDLEIEEIAYLFRVWGESVRQHKWEVYRLSDTQVNDAISYFFPDIEIEKNKYICRYRNILWDKKMDIEFAMNRLKNTYIPTIIVEFDETYRVKTPPLNISIYDAYVFYCRFYSSKTTLNRTVKPFIVSKNYFEKFMLENYSEFIVDSCILLNEWCSSTVKDDNN
jgi:hypothetical protein